MTATDRCMAPLAGASGRHVAGQRLLDEAVADGLLRAAELDVRDRVRALADEMIAPHAAETDRTGVFAHDSYQALARAGFGGLLFPPRLGGTGASTLAYAVAMEEIAAACAATSLIFMTQMHAAYPILVAGTDAQAQQYVPGLCSGDLYGSLAITEPDAGSDVAALRTTARRRDGGYVIDGTKTFITTGDRADVIVCFATVDRSAGRRGVTAFLIDGAAPGLSRGRVLAKMGMHGSTTAELFFDGLVVGDSARLGAEGSGWDLLMASVVKSRISAAAQGVGIARGALARTVTRLAADGPVHQQDTFRLAELRASLLQGRLLLYATARAADSTAGVTTADVAMMKLACTDLAVNTALACGELLGHRGDEVSVGVERCVRDAKVTQIYDGTNEVQRLLIARDTARRTEDMHGI